MIQLPEKFAQDIQGKDTYLVPLIIIDNRLFLSTSKVTLDNQYYEPLVKSLGKIKASIDTQDKKFKISNTSFSLYDYKYNNKYLSDRLFSPSVINKSIQIYYKSQSSESLDDCIKVYTGYIKSIEGSDILNIEAEDKSEKTLHKTLSVQTVRDDIDIPDRYKNKKVPMVYGFVDKAPCVYHDLYSSALEDGASRYSITPDLFFIGGMGEAEDMNTYIFIDDVYLNIRHFSDRFSSESVDTIYENTSKQQYLMLSNKILIDKTISIEDSSTVGDPVESLNASAIAYNMVEVEQIADVNFTNGIYNLYYRKEGSEDKKVSLNIKCYKDLNTLEPSTSILDKPYLDIKDFGNTPQDLSDSEYWFWGSNASSGDLNFPDYENIYGESIINFEALPFCNESNILTELPIDSDGDKKDIKGEVDLRYSLETKIHEYEYPAQVLPYLLFRWSDFATTVWNVNSNDLDGNNIYSESDDVQNRTTRNISNNLFSIGQRKREDGKWVLHGQNGSMEYLKINELKLKRVAILKDFIKRDIFANVSGRVDNIEGTYTGVYQFTSGQRVDTYEEQPMESVGKIIKPSKPSIKAPIKGIKPIKRVNISPELAKPIVKLTKPIIKKGTKY